MEGELTAAVVARATVSTAGRLGVGKVDSDSSSVEVLVVHLLNGSIGLLLGAVGLERED